MSRKESGGAGLQAPMLECVEYPAQCPCRLRSRRVEFDEYPVPHYATSLEIVLTEGVDGYAVIGTNRFDITRDRNGVFVIPPNVVHYTMFRAGTGKIHVFKLSVDLIANYMNVGNLFALRGCAMEEIPGALPERYDAFADVLLRQISYDWQDAWKMFGGLISLFRLLEDCIATRKSDEKSAERLDERIRLIMQWTKDHVQERISVEDAAAQLHYSRYHFCRFFREHVGISYLTYLNTLKIDRAAELMKEGKSTTFCCYECGFTNLSYFISLFRKITGFSTVEYRKRQAMSAGAEGNGQRQLSGAPSDGVPASSELPCSSSAAESGNGSAPLCTCRRYSDGDRR